MAMTPEQERETANTGTKPVIESHRFDEASLAAWMQAHVEGYTGPLEVRQFKGGQSNPTYQLVTPGKKYVLRRKPPGKASKPRSRFSLTLNWGIISLPWGT